MAQLALPAVSPAAGQIRLRPPPTEAPDAGFLAGWSDREIRSITLSSQETDVFLGLLPLSPLATRPAFGMVFRARYRSRYPVMPPGTVEIRVQVGPLFDTNRMRNNVMHFVLDGATAESRRLDLVGRVPDTGVVLPGGRVDVAFFTIPVGLPLLHLVNAETVDGRVFGAIDFFFTSAQIDALREYVTQILSTGRR